MSSPSQGPLGGGASASGQGAAAVGGDNSGIVSTGERLRGAHGALTSRSNLALASNAAGDCWRAAGLNEQILAVRERVLGPEHPDTLQARNNLRRARVAAGLEDEQGS